MTGALDGANGLIQSIIMSRAMSRSFACVLFGGAMDAAGELTKQFAVDDAA